MAAMEGITKIIVAEKEIMVVDYRGIKASEMISFQQQGARLAVSGQKPVRILTIMDGNNFVTPGFVSETEKTLRQLEPFGLVQAIIGISGPKLWILKGLNLFAKKPIQLFSTREEAIKYLTRF